MYYVVISLGDDLVWSQLITLSRNILQLLKEAVLRLRSVDYTMG